MYVVLGLLFRLDVHIHAFIKLDFFAIPNLDSKYLSILHALEMFHILSIEQQPVILNRIGCAEINERSGITL